MALLELRRLAQHLIGHSEHFAVAHRLRVNPPGLRAPGTVRAPTEDRASSRLGTPGPRVLRFLLGFPRHFIGFLRVSGSDVLKLCSYDSTLTVIVNMFNVPSPN